MSTADQPTPTAPVSTFSTTQIAKWEQGVALILNNWRALTDAVSCQWGGPDSADKRDWLCGTVADLFVERPETDTEDVEDVLLQVMADEFEVNLEDDSAYLVAQTVMKLKDQIAIGNFADVDEMQRLWEERGTRRSGPAPVVQEIEEEAGSSEDEDEDTEMQDAPTAPAEPRQRIEPVVDEDGFELVQKRGGRRG
ncbi:hypothetical protein EX30DRAFT_338757 [Ascodesmis nigricans]|uniref:Pre-rRNA-processing protein TSR2 n=1 Tax=Ascodesmis nigricans TaxID=341454 RepID=A0A4S2N4U0_9PEZI|nr:hypothetical protein EX30DRAFT_338757 [Ascodesmis nigricans]